MCYKEFLQLLSTVSSFRHIMITNNLNFCRKKHLKEQGSLHASNSFPFEMYSFADDENIKQFLFRFILVKLGQGFDPPLV